MATWTVTFIGAASSGLSAAQLNEIAAGVQAAGAHWERYLAPSAATISIQVDVTPVTNGNASAASATSVFVTTNGAGKNVFREGVGSELLTGTDPNGASLDAFMALPANYFLSAFVDPDPFARTAAVTPTKLDLQSVLLHELGHVLGFNGFSANNIVDLPSATAVSAYEDRIVFAGGAPFFNGTRAAAVYGSNVPITFASTNNAAHIGNPVGGGAGSDLIADLMNGVVFYFGARYHISPLDIAVLGDTGLALRMASGGGDVLYGYEAIDPALVAQAPPAPAFFKGEDSLSGLGGNDTLYGLSGADTLFGGAGGDDLFGGAGFDLASYGTASSGVTVNLVSPGSNTGDAAGDTLRADIEGIIGSTFVDFLQGNSGANELRGGAGNDTLLGGFGDDTLTGGSGADSINGGDGFDIATYRDAGGAVRVALWNPASNTGDAAGDIINFQVEVVEGSPFNDNIQGNSSDNNLRGGAGNDLVLGGFGNDTLIGGSGADDFGGGDGFDTVSYATATAAVRVALYNPALHAGDAAGDNIRADIEVVQGSTFNDSLEGSAANNNLRGGGGNDAILGGFGDDTVWGQAGNDTLTGGAGSDRFVFEAGGGADRLQDFAGGAGLGDVINLTGFGAAFDSFAEVSAAASQSGANVVINFGGGATLTLANVVLATLNADDFVFG